MTVFRFLTRAFHLDRVVNPGEEIDLPEGTVPGPHMIDVAAEAAAAERGEPYPPPAAPVAPAGAVLRADLAHDPGYVPVDVVHQIVDRHRSRITELEDGLEDAQAEIERLSALLKPVEPPGASDVPPPAPPAQPDVGTSAESEHQA